MKAHTHSRSRRRPQRPAWDRPKAHLDVQYHPGVEGVDNILRPSLLSVGGGTCFRLVKESWPWGPEGIKGEELAGKYLCFAGSLYLGLNLSRPHWLHLGLSRST